MIKDNLFTGKESREKLMGGVRKASQAVAITMGTSGSNSLIETIESPGHATTNDGATILNSIKFADPLEEIGRKVLNEAVSRANKASGDGSSTTCVLTQAILEEGSKHLGEVSPMEIKRSLEECLPLIEESIKSQKRNITVDEVSAVASISAEDEQIGNKIQEIYKQIGKEGIIHWDISKTAEDYYTIGTGITINGATYASPYMGDMVSPTEFSVIATMKEPLVMLLRQKITTGADFSSLFESLYNQNKKEIVIFCDEIEVPAIVHLLLTQQQRGFRSLVVKMPVLWKDEWWQDLSYASGSVIIDPLSGIQIKNIKEEHLGKFGNIKVTKEDTFIDGIKDMTQHIADLITQGDDASLLRASRLNTRTARYFVGALSEQALYYKRLKVEDAINAASCALEGGIVSGGGIALLNASKELKDDSIGGIILKEALQKPFNQILENAGMADKINPNTMFSDGQGFDSRIGKIVNMFDAGIVDPTDIVINSIKNAIGVAASILTFGTIITLPRDEQVRDIHSVS